MPEMPEPQGPKPAERPVELPSQTYRKKMGCGNLYITVSSGSQGQPFEVFLKLGKMGACQACLLEALGRLASLSLRCGVSSGYIVAELVGIQCPQPGLEDGQRVTSCPDAVAQVLRGREGSDAR